MTKLDLNRAIFLISAIESKEIPSWICNLLRELNLIFELPDVHKEIIKIGQHSTDWIKGKKLFSDIRKSTVNSKTDIEEGIYCLLENSSKSIYNSSGAAFPFDQNSSAWLLMNLSFLVEKMDNVRLKKMFEEKVLHLAYLAG